MDPSDIVKRYVSCLEKSDLNSMLELFSPGATVVSPLYGEVRASEFFGHLFADTKKSKINLIDVYRSYERPYSVAASFVYDWTIISDTTARLDCVDLFDVNGQTKRIDKLRIIYDTYPIRENWGDMKGL